MQLWGLNNMDRQFYFYSGKGGVGKTSMACVAAVRYAEQGKKTLIVTTDPASNLADVFEQSIGHQITPIQGVANLWAMEIDPDLATEEYKNKALAPIRAAFPKEMVAVIDEQMSGPCTTEVAAFDRFTDFLDQSHGNGTDFDIIIFDTAPTGHTLRLLELPFEWSQSIDLADQGSGQTCLGPSAAIQESKLKYERAMRVLRDGSLTTFFFVLHPEAIAIKETKRAITELKKLNIQTFQIIINGIIPAQETKNPLFGARAKMQAQYLKQIDAELPYPAKKMVLLSGEIKGVEKLRQVSGIYFDNEKIFEQYQPEKAPTAVPFYDPSLAMSHILPNGNKRTLFFAGKGGVGKTVSSCITAVWLARQGYRTLLLTTDPAAHLGDVLGVPVGDSAQAVPGMPNLWAARIDPKAAADEYKARILNDARQRGRSEESIQVMAEELDSPCTEEMAGFDRFIDFASQSDWQVIVFDTAPTGHTLRLIELPVDWNQQLNIKVFATVDSTAADDVAKKRFGDVIAMMRDPEQSTFAYVMYPEATPILEAHRAVEELATVGIQAGMVVVNQIIPEGSATTPFVKARRTMQAGYLNEIGELFPVPMLQIPLQPAEIKGLEMLSKLGDQIFNNEKIPQPG
jgi:arsenite-transporting ATPase